MIVIVDSNEQATNSTAVNNMRKVFPDLIVSHLQTGDVNVILDDGRKLAIERKKPYDFLASIADGRLFNQVERMSVCDFSCVIITGGFVYDADDKVIINGQRKGETTNWYGGAVRAALIIVQMASCPVIFSSPRMFAHDMLEFIKVASKPTKHYQKVVKRRIVTFPPIADNEEDIIKIEILAQFNGVGAKKAKSLLEFVGVNGKFGTLANAIEWGSSVIPHLDEKPKFWGKETILNFRTILGLAEDERIKIIQLPICQDCKKPLRDSTLHIDCVPF